MIWLGPGLTVPEALAERLSGYRPRACFQGDDARTWRLEREGHQAVYLKAHPDPDEQQPLAVERFVLHRLRDGALPVPRPVHYVRLEDTEYLILTALPGQNLAEALTARTITPDAAIAVLAAAISRIHEARPAWPEEINALPSRLEQARARVRAHRASAEALADFERHWTEPAVRTFVHGDLCLPNVLVHEGGLSGLVDWSRAGYGDPWQDLALAGRSLAQNIGPGDWTERLAQACGLPELDEDRVALWLAFDELF